MIRRRDAWPLGAIGFILAVSAAWWSFALWSVPEAPEWLARARAVCFNITESGLPDAKGWLLLVGQPPTMLAFLLVGWGRDVRESLRHLRSSRRGRMALASTLALMGVGSGFATGRVAMARVPAAEWGATSPSAASPVPLDRPWPAPDGLVDHTGAPFSLSSLGGRPALVTFAFGHCETLCPVVVHRSLAARDELERAGVGGSDLSLVVFTLDPWRDTPSRLPALFDQWGLDATRDLVVGGPVEEVDAALDAWMVARTRDPRSGDIVHAGIVYVVEPRGTIAFAWSGRAEDLVGHADRLRVDAAP